MIIGIDGRYAEGDLVGVGKYIKCLALGLAESGEKVVIYYSKQPKYSIKDKNITTKILRTRNRYWFEQILLPNSLKRDQVSIYHATGNVGVPILKSIPCVLTIHDLIPLVFSNYFMYSKLPMLSRLSFMFRQYSSAILARKIIAVSKSTKREVLKILKISDSKVTVVYSGTSSFRSANTIPANLKSKKYILNNGGIADRKNIDKLIKAFAKITNKFPEYKLVITGENNVLVKGLTTISRNYGIEDKVVFTGYVNDSTMTKLIKASACICYPSFYEGFGFPVVEGFAAGVPVITSNTSSLAEVGGKAAMLVNPHKTSEITNALLNVLTDKNLRKFMTKQGKKEAEKYNWNNAVDKTLSVYTSTLK